MNLLVHRLFWRADRRFARFSYWFSRTLTPLGKLVVGGVVVSAVFGANTDLSMVYQIFSLLVSLLFFSVVSAFFMRVKLESGRYLPDQVMVGKPFEYELRVVNRANSVQKDIVFFENFIDPRPDFNLFMKARDEPAERKRNAYDRLVGFQRFVRLTQKTLGIHVEMLRLEQIAAHGEVRLRLQATATRRGVIHFTGLAVGRADPLGLFRVFTVQSLPDTLLVVPQCHPLPAHFYVPGGRKHLPGGMNLVSQVGEQDEFVSLRGYRPGDGLRSIHWPSLAKTGKPVVVERQEEFFTRHGLILDTLNSVNETVFEGAVSLAASLAAGHGNPDGLLDFMFVGLQNYHFTTGRGFGSHRRILEILASTQPVHDQPFTRLSHLVLGQAGRLSGVIVILIHWDQEREHLLHSLIALGVPMRVFLLHDDDSAFPLPKKMFPGFYLLSAKALRQGIGAL